MRENGDKQHDIVQIPSTGNWADLRYLQIQRGQEALEV